jgi:hypothetical protein
MTFLPLTVFHADEQLQVHRPLCFGWNYAFIKQEDILPFTGRVKKRSDADVQD